MKIGKKDYVAKKPDWNKVPKPVTKFKVRIAKGGARFWDVKIFATKKDMYAYEKATGSRLKEDYEAVTKGGDRYKMPPKGSRKKPVLDSRWQGEMVFHADCIPPMVVAHEATHAALFTFEREGVKRIPTSNRSDHERFCDAVGRVTHEIARGIDKWMSSDAYVNWQDIDAKIGAILDEETE